MRKTCLVLLTLLFLSTIAVADCAAPANPGVRICSPTTDATLAYGPEPHQPFCCVDFDYNVPAIDFNATPAPGARIVKIKAYNNNVAFFEEIEGRTGAMISCRTCFNGVHNVAVNAWDSAGNVYQARVRFNVVGEGYSNACQPPSSPGINFCTPPNGAVGGGGLPLAAAARGVSNISAIRFYVDDKINGTMTGTNLWSSIVGTQPQGTHRLTFVAWDSRGNVFKSPTRTIRTSYTYDAFTCPPRGDCFPGIRIWDLVPQPNAYVGNSFTFTADVQTNPNPITTMKAYIDNTVVATSTGPHLSMPVTNAPNGTHIVTVQAWDTAGLLYRIQYNLNINVPH